MFLLAVVGAVFIESGAIIVGKVPLGRPSRGGFLRLLPVSCRRWKRRQ
jgi:hypothetical protein